MTKLKAFADDKLNVAKMMISVLDFEANIVGKGESTSFQHFFFLCPQCFQQLSDSGFVKTRNIVINVKYQYVTQREAT